MTGDATPVTGDATPVTGDATAVTGDATAAAGTTPPGSTSQRPADAPLSPLSRALGWILAVLTAGFGIYGTAFWLLRDVGPPASAFPAAAKIIRDEHQAGDLILLVPFYATQAREYLGDLDPVAPKDPLREDLRATERVWIFATYGETPQLAELVAGLEHAGFTREKAWDPSPGIKIERWLNAAAWTTTYDFRAHLKDARVFHEHSDGKQEPCAAWTDANGQGAPFGGRWACPHDAEWFYVSPEWHRMGDHPRWCFWAHPPSDGRLLIHFPGVPLTGHLAGRAGHTLNSSKHAHAPIHLDVSVGDARPQRFTIGLDEYWRPLMLTTPTTGTATVTFAVSTPDAGANHFCFTASMRAAPDDARGPPPAAPPHWRAPR